MNHHKLILFLGLFLFHSMSAETLKTLSYRSTVILALSENPEMAKKCLVDSTRISELSQLLKIKVDQKISALVEKDFKIIEKRIGICKNDCSCNLDSLALSQSGKLNTDLERLAASETAKDRKRCLKAWRNYCKWIQFK